MALTGKLWSVAVVSILKKFKRVIMRLHPLLVSLIGLTWGPSGAHRTQMGPMLAPWTLLSRPCIGMIFSSLSLSSAHPLMMFYGKNTSIASAYIEHIYLPRTFFVIIWLNFDSTWISNHMQCEMADGIINPFLYFNGCAVDVWEWISNSTLHVIMDVITSAL